LLYPLRNVEEVAQKADGRPREAVTGKKRRHSSPSKAEKRGIGCSAEDQEEGEVSDQEDMEQFQADQSPAAADCGGAGQASGRSGGSREEGIRGKLKSGTARVAKEQSGEQQQRQRGDEDGRRDDRRDGAQTGHHKIAHLPERGGGRGVDHGHGTENRRETRGHDPMHSSKRNSHDGEHRKRLRSYEEPLRHDRWRGYDDQDAIRNELASFPRGMSEHGDHFVHEDHGMSVHVDRYVHKDQPVGTRWSHAGEVEEPFGRSAAFVPGYGGGGGGRGGTRNLYSVADMHGNRKHQTQQRSKHIRFY
jgi:hypothetical protein